MIRMTIWHLSKVPLRSTAAMSAKAISEQTAKELLFKSICPSTAVQNRFRYAGVTAETDWARLTQEHPWLLTEVRKYLKSILEYCRGDLFIVCPHLSRHRDWW